MSEWRRRLAKNVKTRREARAYTQAGLGRLIGSSEDYISDIEQAAAYNVTLSVLEALANEFVCTEADLLREDMSLTPSVTDLIQTLSLAAARNITGMVLKARANWGESVLKVRVHAFVREALVAMAQLPETSDTKSFRMTACGVLLDAPQVFDQGCTGFTLVGIDYIDDRQGARRRVETRIWFLAFADVGQEIVRSVRKGDQLEVAAWARTNMWPTEPGDRNSDLTMVVESFRFRRPTGQTVFRRRSRRSGPRNRGSPRRLGRRQP
jgi:transcriptional regulator with XRE-family HTH domain